MNSAATQSIKKSAPRKSSSQQAERGRKKVEARLIRATCALLATHGPRAVTIRDIATRAGVNHGQIHHYFGGKKGLIAAAVRHLAQEHADHVAQREHDAFDGPAPLTLGEDATYIMSIVRLVLDGELELATLELADDNSVPRHMLEQVTKSLGYRKATTEIKSAMAAAMAIELAWAALEPYILRVVDCKASEVPKVREQVGAISRHLLSQLQPRPSRGSACAAPAQAKPG